MKFQASNVCLWVLLLSSMLTAIAAPVWSHAGHPHGTAAEPESGAAESLPHTETVAGDALAPAVTAAHGMTHPYKQAVMPALQVAEAFQLQALPSGEVTSLDSRVIPGSSVEVGSLLGMGIMAFPLLLYAARWQFNQ